MSARGIGARATRKVSLLRTLDKLNNRNIFPSMSRLIREDEPHGRIPQNTLISRRAMLRELEHMGYLEIRANPTTRLLEIRIKHKGIELLAKLEVI